MPEFKYLCRLACPACCSVPPCWLACTTAEYTVFEYRNGSKIIDGEGGSKRVVDGVEIWDAGDPPHRYRIMGMIRVSDYDMATVNSTMLRAIAQQVRRPAVAPPFADQQRWHARCH
jgi:hypothetical protein